MPKRPAAFTQADVARAVRAMIDAGLPVAGVRVDAGGATVLTSAPEPSEGRLGEALNAADVASALLDGPNGQNQDSILSGRPIERLLATEARDAGVRIQVGRVRTRRTRRVEIGAGAEPRLAGGQEV